MDSCEGCTPRARSPVKTGRHKTVTDSNCTKGHVCQYALIVMNVCIRFQEVLSATFKEKKKDFGRIFKVVKGDSLFGCASSFCSI